MLYCFILAIMYLLIYSLDPKIKLTQTGAKWRPICSVALKETKRKKKIKKKQIPLVCFKIFLAKMASRLLVFRWFWILMLPWLHHFESIKYLPLYSHKIKHSHWLQNKNNSQRCQVTSNLLPAHKESEKEKKNKMQQIPLVHLWG